MKCLAKSETQNGKIQRLEQTVKEKDELIADLMRQNDKLYQTIYEKNQDADESFLQSPHYHQITLELETTKIALQTTEHRFKLLEERLQARERYIEKLETTTSNQLSVKNERGAGRKAKLTTEQVENLKEDRNSGMTLVQLKEKYKCSYGLVQKIAKSLIN